MARSVQLFILAVTIFLFGCKNSDTLWESGNYRVYARPNSREIIMGYHFGDGGILGLSEATVTSAGANTRYVVFVVGLSEYYYIVREPDGEGSTHGPFNKSEYMKLKSKHSLPPFQWHNK